MVLHLTFPRGKRVIIHMKDGEIFVDRYIEKKGSRVFLEERGEVPTKLIRSCTYYRNANDREGTSD